MAPPQSPCILRANLIKAKSSVPAVNCYLWGSFFFSKVVGYFQKHTDLGNRTQHTNEFTPLADFMQTTSKLNMRSGFSLPRTHGRGFCSLSLSFMQAFFHTIRHYRIECFSMEKLRFFFFFSVTWKGSWLPVAFSLINGHATVVDSWGRMDWNEGLWAVINLLLDYAG